MYVETSIFGVKKGDVAILKSPEYNVTDLDCTFCMLEFWYHMYGSTVDRLEVGYRIVSFLLFSSLSFAFI